MVRRAAAPARRDSPAAPAARRPPTRPRANTRGYAWPSIPLEGPLHRERAGFGAVARALDGLRARGLQRVAGDRECQRLRGPEHARRQGLLCLEVIVRDVRLHLRVDLERLQRHGHLRLDVLLRTVDLEQRCALDRTT